MTSGLTFYKAAQGHIPSVMAMEAERGNNIANELMANEFIEFIDFLNDVYGDDWRKKLMSEFDAWQANQRPLTGYAAGAHPGEKER